MDLSGKIGIWGFGKEGQSLLKHLNVIGTSKELTILLDEPFNDEVIKTPVLSGNEAIKTIKSG